MVNFKVFCFFFELIDMCIDYRSLLVFDEHELDGFINSLQTVLGHGYRCPTHVSLGSS